MSATLVAVLGPLFDRHREVLEVEGHVGGLVADDVDDQVDRRGMGRLETGGQHCELEDQNRQKER
jgi:hypothetical protein